MPLPRVMARSVSRFINPGALKRASWPVLVHVGRTSGKTYRTPLGVEQIDGGYLFFVNYGSKTDWVQNTVAARSAVLEIDGRERVLHNPRVLPAHEAFELLSPDTKTPPGWVGLEECLVVDVTNPAD